MGTDGLAVLSDALRGVCGVATVVTPGTIFLNVDGAEAMRRIVGGGEGTRVGNCPAAGIADCTNRPGPVHRNLGWELVGSNTVWVDGPAIIPGVTR